MGNGHRRGLKEQAPLELKYNGINNTMILDDAVNYKCYYTTTTYRNLLHVCVLLKNTFRLMAEHPVSIYLKQYKPADNRDDFKNEHELGTDK